VGHHIVAILIPAPVDAEAARRLDLQPVALTPSLTMLHVDHYFTAYWQAVRGTKEYLDVPADFPPIYPREGVVRAMVCELTGNAASPFALVMTDYFGGTGSQWGCVFRGAVRSSEGRTINEALRALGIVRREGQDEFDTVGLGNHRHSPDYLERYVALCDELGV
jgi:hypothetical protein